ncbi:MAG: LysM peptidoglycan-binding domain-containing protein [Bacilli bacterium]
MQIHVVQKGQSLSGISSAYNTTKQEIMTANGLSGEKLAIGQSLLIPITGSYYWVQSGDSLWKIGKKFGMTSDQLAKINKLNASSPLSIGLRLYIPPQPKQSIQTNGYVQPTSTVYKDAIVNDMKDHSAALTYSAIFSYEMKVDGTLQAPPLEPILSISLQNKTIPMLVVSNIENGDFSSELAHSVLQSVAVQEKLIQNILKEAKKNSMTDIHFDFERVLPEDRLAYNKFLRLVKNSLPPGYTLSTTLVPKTSSSQSGVNYEAQDYKAHGEIVDFVVIMTYDWGWQGGEPQAVSPIGPVDKVIQYAKSQMPASKIMMGQNLYGFDWTLPYKPGNPPAKAVSNVGATDLAIRYGATILYDEKAQAPHFTYTDESGKKHEVWFEDIRSVRNKMQYASDQGLKGLSYWKMGLSFPANWLYLTDRYNVVKKG